MNEIFYLAYGSNLNLRQMTRALPYCQGGWCFGNKELPSFVQRRP